MFIKINTHSIEHQLEIVLKNFHPSVQLRLLEKLSMKIRKENGLRINDEVKKTMLKYPKTKEQHNNKK